MFKIITQRIITWGIGLLVIFLPVHLLLARTIELWIFDSNLVYAWKEGILLVCIISCGIYVYVSIKSWTKQIIIVQALLILLHICLLITNVIVWQTPLYLFLLGYRFEMLWISALLMFVSYVGLQEGAIQTSLKKLLTMGITLGFYIHGIITSVILIIGQKEFLSYLYSSNADQNASPQVCHAIDAGIEGCRLSSGFSHPNHYAGYLLLMTGFGLYTKNRIITALSLFFMVFTVSRFAIAGVLLYVLWFLIVKYKNTLKKPIVTFISKNGLYISLILASLVVLIPVFGGLSFIPILPASIAKPSSTFFHEARFKSALEIIKNNPDNMLFGYGQSQSGPSAKVEYYDILNENTIIAENEPIAYQNGLVGEDLTIPENWYIQVLFNGGVIYLVLYVFALMYSLQWGSFFSEKSALTIGVISLFAGNMVLHLFESSQLVLYVVIMYLFIYVADNSSVIRSN